MRYVGRSWKDAEEGPVVVVVDVHGRERPLDPRFDLRRHSPDGFAWGYGGSGPAQLALAILAHHVGRLGPARLEALKRKAGWSEQDRGLAEPPTLEKRTWPDYVALRFYQQFKMAVVARFSQDEGFSLTTEQVDEALDAIVGGKT